MTIRLVTRLRGLLRRSRAATELDEELQFHLQHEIEANVARGMSAGEARRVALRDLGGLMQTREAVRDVRSLWIESVWRDTRHAMRALIAAPSFSLVVVAVLTLTIAASASVFSVVDAVVLRPLPYDDPDRLVGISEPTRQNVLPTRGDLLVSPQEFFDWRDRQDVFAGLAASAWTEISVKAAGEDFPERLSARWVTANYFDVLGRTPLLGRPFTADNEVPGRNHVALISHQLWQRRFGGDRSVIGKQLPGQLAAFDVIGVMPSDFRDPDDTAEGVQVWIPFVPDPDARIRGNSFGYFLRVVARLRDGVSIEHAQSRMNGIMTDLAVDYPRWVKGRVARVESLHASVTRGVRTWMLMLLGAVACVLLIGTVNLANLMLARGWVRRQELAVRAALGASRAALARVLIVESLILSTTGAVLGAAVAWLSVGYLRSSLPSELPRAGDVAIDARVLAVTMGLSVAIGLVLGLVPVRQFVGAAASTVLVGQQRSVSADRAAVRLRGWLVVAEVAIAAVLLVGAALFASSFMRVTRVDLGLDYHNVLTLRLRPLVRPTDVNPGQAPLLRTLDRVRAIPGVEVVALGGNGLPLRGDLLTEDFSIPGGVADGDMALNQVTPDYFRALRIPVRNGRVFSDADVNTGQKVVILNELAARRLFGTNALGKTMRWSNYGDRTVVGIVGDIRYDGPEEPTRPQAFVPIVQTRQFAATLIVRTTPGTASSLLPAIGRVISEEYPAGAVAPLNIETGTLEHYFGELVAQRRVNMRLLGLFGLLGAVVAGIGVYGVLAYLVAQRTREIGIRVALGAPRAAIVRSVFVLTAKYAVAGLAAGTLAAWMFSRLVRGLLFSVEPHDPAIYVVVGLTIFGLAALAALVPARRAASVDPIVALRCE
jgi:putative ABC transport system permease protein